MTFNLTKWNTVCPPYRTTNFGRKRTEAPWHYNFLPSQKAQAKQTVEEILSLVHEQWK